MARTADIVKETATILFSGKEGIYTLWKFSLSEDRT